MPVGNNSTVVKPVRVCAVASLQDCPARKSIGDRLIRHSRTPAEMLGELASEYPGILTPYFARVNVRGGPTSLFSLAPNPLLDSLAALPIRVPFHSIIGNRGIDDGAESSDGVVSYRSAPLEGAE